MSVQQGEYVPRKSNTLGVVLIVLGLLVLAFAAFEYSVYRENRETLDWNDFWGTDTPAQHDLVAKQFVTSIGAFTVAALLLMFGVANVSGVHSYNKDLDRQELLSSIRHAEKPRCP